MQTHPAKTTASPRRGLLSMELVLTLPILTILLLGLIEFSSLLLAYGTLREASQAGAQAALRENAQQQDVLATVRDSLGEELFAVARVECRPAGESQNRARCHIRVPMSVCAPNLLGPLGFSWQGRHLQCDTEISKAQAHHVRPAESGSKWMALRGAY